VIVVIVVTGLTFTFSETLRQSYLLVGNYQWHYKLKAPIGNHLLPVVIFYRVNMYLVSTCLQLVYVKW
jgi:hypothetical protein